MQILISFMLDTGQLLYEPQLPNLSNNFSQDLDQTLPLYTNSASIMLALDLNFHFLWSNLC